MKVKSQLYGMLIIQTDIYEYICVSMLLKLSNVLFQKESN